MEKWSVGDKAEGIIPVSFAAQVRNKYTLLMYFHSCTVPACISGDHSTISSEFLPVPLLVGALSLNCEAALLSF